MLLASGFLLNLVACLCAYLCSQHQTWLAKKWRKHAGLCATLLLLLSFICFCNTLQTLVAIFVCLTSGMLLLVAIPYINAVLPKAKGLK